MNRRDDWAVDSIHVCAAREDLMVAATASGLPYR